MTSPTVLLDGVGYTANFTPILTGIHLSVSPGEAIGIHGPNGAGKSTLLALVATFIRPTEGRIELFGVPSTQRPRRDLRTRIGWVGHDSGLYPGLTLKENLGLHARLGDRPETAVRSVIDQLGLSGSADRRASASSSGMQRRIDLGRILLAEPELVLLDEPDAGLDSGSTAIVDAIIDRTVARGGSVILVSHHSDSLANRVGKTFRMEQGRIPT